MGLFDFWKKVGKKSSSKLENNKEAPFEIRSDNTNAISDNDSFKHEIAEYASKVARDKGLDFSVESLKKADILLEDARDVLDPDEQMPLILNAAKLFGYYVFEVARRKYGGEYFWYDRFDQPILVIGQPNFEVSFLAVEKAKERILNGSEDNIPFYFKGIEEAIQRGQNLPGYKALIV